MTEIVLLDGGMGQELVRRSAQPAHPQWSARVLMEEPEIVQAVHEDFIRAGAHVLTLNTYSVTRGRFEKFGMPEQLAPQHRKAIELANAARDATRTDVIVAGCLSPLAGSYHPELLPPDADLLEEYREVVALQAGAADLFICETMSKASEARMAAMAARETGLPVWVAWTLRDHLDADGAPTLRSGESIAEALAALDGLEVEAVLFNCCPPETISAGLPGLAGSGRAFGGYANGFGPIPHAFTLGQTVDMLGKRRDFSPAEYTRHCMDWVAAGATIVGGCCEVGPAHIADISRALQEAGHRTTGAPTGSRIAAQ